VVWAVFMAMKPSTVLHRILLRARPQQRSISFVPSECWHWIHPTHPPRRTFPRPQYHVWKPYSSLPVTQNSNVPSTSSPIDFTAAAKIEGDESHIAIVRLQPGEMLRAESGAMVFMTEGVVSKYINRLQWIVLLIMCARIDSNSMNLFP
jgi:Mitochondrial biogenesis AIM24